MCPGAASGATMRSALLERGEPVVDLDVLADDLVARRARLQLQEDGEVLGGAPLGDGRLNGLAGGGRDRHRDAQFVGGAQTEVEVLAQQYRRERGCEVEVHVGRRFVL